jgi:hypothetical protein
MKGNVKFTRRLGAAIHDLGKIESLGLHACVSRSLYSPVAMPRGQYAWAKIMDCDGLLVGERQVKQGEGADTTRPVTLRFGVVIQSEDATSQSKPNPLGKASLSHIPNGVWVNLKKAGRVRLDRVLVVFLLPKGATPAHAAKFSTAKRNVENAAKLMPDCKWRVLPRQASASLMATELERITRSFIKGPGRPQDT